MVNSRRKRRSEGFRPANSSRRGAYDRDVDSTTQALLFALLGAVLGAGVVLAWRVSEREMYQRVPAEEPAVPPGIATVLSVLRSSALVVDETDEVVKASAPAYAFGVVSGNQVNVQELADLIRQVRRDGQIRETELVMSRGRGIAPQHVTARVAPLSSRLVLALVEDRTRERRVEAIRRDFVANVSHELKTPVGALNLLAEAVQEAADDPEAVSRFAGRMQTESARLNRLVQQIIELSRLQGDDPLEDPQVVDVDEVVTRAIDQSDIDAQSKNISLVHNGEGALQILGNRDEVALALGNLVANAVAYSPGGSTVVVGARANERMVDLTITDQGIGIPARELERIFERFYRVDPARHRSTGGTGLGLSIVKHVAASHGGEVRVWSVEGQGSTFTLSLPRRVPERPPVSELSGGDVLPATSPPDGSVLPKRQEAAQ
jgi:two-component system sensor histidine kinase SenX3